MNKKTIITLGFILAMIICISGSVAWGTYQVLNIPSVKKGLQTAGGEFNAMFQLRKQILETYQCQDVGVQLMNGDTLNISLINSEFNSLSSSGQSASAYEIASFIKDKYTGKAEITRIVITFVENNRIGPLNTNWSSSYSFTMSDLE
jgi:hypothetical protein